MGKLLKKKTTSSTAKKNKVEFEEIEGKDIEVMTPEETYIVKMDVEPDSTMLVIYKDKSIVTCMDLDTKECLNIPTVDFHKGKYTYEYEDNGKIKTHTTQLEIHRKL